MTLPPLVLDDLTWETLTEAARRRIPAASGGTWTLHAPVDPGITLLELFAYQLEQRLYHLDQVPDELVLAVLDLLGVEAPRAAVPAATVLRVEVDQARPAPVAVAAGTEFSRDPMRRIVFALEAAVTVLPFAHDPLTPVGGRSAALTPAGAELRLEFPLLDGYRLPEPGTALGLLLDLDSPAACPPSWLPTAVDGVPPPADWSWTWYDPAEPDRRWPVEGLEDGTAGLRRGGLVTLPLPGAWCAGGSAVRAYGLLIAGGMPPVLRQAVPNAGVARHAVHRTADAPTGAWHRLPGQEIVLPDARGTLIDATVTVVRRGEQQTWNSVPGLAFAGPGDRVLTVDREAGAIRFGDGLTGGIPVPDAGPGTVTAAYTSGGGTAGNGGLSTNWVADPQPFPDAVLSAANVVAAAGGQEPETIAEARARAADRLAETSRAVTAADFADLAVRTPGVAVARCHVAIGAHPAYPCVDVPGAVTVLVLPSAGRQPDPGALAAVRARLDAEIGRAHV